MHKNARQFLDEAIELLNEIETYEGYKEHLLISVERLNDDYQNERFGYLVYKEQLKLVLKDKSREEWVGYYNAYVYSLLKKAELLLSRAFYLVYNDDSYLKLVVDKSKPEQKEPEQKPTAEKESIVEKATAILAKPKVKVFDIENEIERLRERLETKAARHPEEGKGAEPASFKAPRIPTTEELAAVLEVEKSTPLLEEVIKEKKGFKLPSMHLPRFKLPSVKLTLPRMHVPGMRRILGLLSLPVKMLRAKKPKTVIEPAKKAPIVFWKFPTISIFKKKPKERPEEGLKLPLQKKGIISRLKAAFAPKRKTIFVEEIVEMEKRSRREEKKEKLVAGERVVIGWFSNIKLIRDFFVQRLVSRFKSKQEPIMGERTAIPLHVKKLREMRAKLYAEEKLSTFDTTLLAQEAKRVKKILEAEKPEVYKGTSIGLIANVSVKKISLFLVESFPEFFGYLYNALREANVKILSNTYVNIMILCAITISFFTSFALLFVFFALNYAIYQVVLRSVLFGIFAGGMCATIFYVYPFLKIKERRRNTMANLPFAINHVASVSASGVPPAAMFELIAKSGEYGEVAVEIKKIVDFINLFGYDLLTAIKSVAATTPSQQFKEFLEGMVSTIETGGNLESYVKQKADEATLTYQLERQRYNQSISTYSDIYTGLLIAAPLFFIAALALVNLLGGSIGGLGVDVTMALGAYVAIPLMNIAFIGFLQISQPQV